MNQKKLISRAGNKFLNTIFYDRRFRRVSYSQDAEDLLLAGFLFHTGKKGDYKGFFVDIGSHCPYRYSNIAIFYERGWRGIRHC